MHIRQAGDGSPPALRGDRARRATALVLGSLALAIVMTWPLAAGLGSLGRTGIPRDSDRFLGRNADGHFSLWNVAWVARTIVTAPRELFHANIFHPHTNTLAYSEANLVAGIVGVPVWWATRNPYATLNVVILFGFTTAFLGAWLLARHVTGDPAAATLAGIFYAFCPYVFSHTSHIQLMLTGGIPLSMLMLHRLADVPSARRGAALGVALLVQALACAYYGLFAALMVAFGVLFFTVSRGHAASSAWWKGVGLGASVSIGAVLPFLIPFRELQQGGFSRTVGEAALYSANVTSYLTSSAPAHAWLRQAIADWPPYVEVMFPGIGLLILGVSGVAAGLARQQGTRTERETVLLYGLLGLLAFWASFGPAAGAYRLLFEMPMFSFLRAPARFAIVVVLCLAIPAAFVVTRLLRFVETRRKTVVCAVTLAALAELAILPFPWERALPVPVAYQRLAELPSGPIAKFPFYGSRGAWHLNSSYMVFSTTHWMPMLNGYSDYIPAETRKDAFDLRTFPSERSFRVLQRERVRYIGVHWDMFGPRAAEIKQRLQPYQSHLKVLAAGERMTLFEITGFP